MLTPAQVDTEFEALLMSAVPNATMVVFKSIDRRKNHRRIYKIVLKRTLFCDDASPNRWHQLFLRWGRADTGFHDGLVERFTTREEALEKARKVTKERLRHGYEVSVKGKLYREMKAQGVFPDHPAQDDASDPEP